MAGYNNPYLSNYGYTGGYAYPTPTQAPSYQPQGFMVGWVNSEEDGRNTYVAPGSSAYFMDKNLPVMYMKSVDATGHVSDFKVYELVEKKVETKPDTTGADFKEYVAGIVAQAMADAGWKPRKKKEDE